MVAMWRGKELEGRRNRPPGLPETNCPRVPCRGERVDKIVECRRPSANHLPASQAVFNSSPETSGWSSSLAFDAAPRERNARGDQNLVQYFKYSI